MARGVRAGTVWFVGLLAAVAAARAEIFVASNDGVRVFADNAGGDSTDP